MAFSITDITSAMNRRGGLARPTHFYVSITPPSTLQYASYSREVPFFCSDAVLPGMVFQTMGVKTGGYGVSEFRPHDVTFNEVSLTFMVDSDAKVIDYFQKWMTLIHNWSIDTAGVQQGSKLAYGEFAYPEDYEAPRVSIYYFNPAGDEIIRYDLNRAFPVQIGSIGVGWEMNDQISKLPITFAYKNWDTESVPPSEMDSIEGERLMTNFYASQRFDYGRAEVFGLNLLQNGRRSPFTLISSINAFATAII
jgi:hypothetical protein